MKRRSFLKTIWAAILGTSVSPMLVTGVSKASPSSYSTREESMRSEAENLVSYCGSFCGSCKVSGFNMDLGVAAVTNVVSAAGFKGSAESIGWPVMREIATHSCAQFEQQVQSFSELAVKLFPTTNKCRDGCVPGCHFAECCKRKGYFTCADCEELLSCSKIADITKKNPKIKQNLKEIANIGIKKWAEAQYATVKSDKKRLMIEAIDRAFE